jgi:hypothetical protein
MLDGLKAGWDTNSSSDLHDKYCTKLYNADTARDCVLACTCYCGALDPGVAGCWWGCDDVLFDASDTALGLVGTLFLSFQSVAFKPGAPALCRAGLITIFARTVPSCVIY